MPTEEIKKIAREYARYTCSDISDAQERATDENIEYDFALPIFEWLSKDFCIVPKSKLKNEYKKSYSAAFEQTTCLDRQYARGRYQVLREIFGTELFNEEKE